MSTIPDNQIMSFMKNNFVNYMRQLVVDIGDQMLPLSVMLGSMVYMMACYIDSGSIHTNHNILPKFVFCLAIFNFAVTAIRENSKLCFALTLLGLPGALVVIQGGLGMVSDMGPAQLGFLEMADIGAAMIVTLPFVLLAGSLGITAWREIMKFVSAVGILKKSPR